MIKSKVTSKAQTTIPLAVRNALHLKPGDEVAYQIDGDKVVLSRSPKEEAEDPFASFSEWDSEADRKAYASL